MRARDPGRDFVAAAEAWRLRYAKRGRMRFASHRDFQRAFERALRRARVPIAYSAGFRPHPRISYAGAAPTAAASEAEYLEIAVAEAVDGAWLRQAVNEALPDGFEIVDAVRATTKEFASRLEASRWQIEISGWQRDDLLAPVASFLREPEIFVERVTKSGRREVDVRGRVTELVALSTPVADGPCAILGLVLLNGTPSARASDVLDAMWRVAGIAPSLSPRMTRLAQGPLAADALEVGDPLALDRAAQPTAQM